MMVPDSTKFQVTRLNGIEFKTTTIGNRKHFVFFLTGMSLVNAAMNTQLALDRFNVTALFSPASRAGSTRICIPATW